MAIRLEVTKGYFKTHEVIVETRVEADRLWVELVKLSPETAGGCAISDASIPPAWYAFPGEDVRGTESYSEVATYPRRVTKRG
jgi:hypothetical protein